MTYLPVAAIPVPDALDFIGTWNADTNTPALADGVGTKNGYYVVSDAGTTSLDGIDDWDVGDWAVFNGSTWQKLSTSDINRVQTIYVAKHGDNDNDGLTPDHPKLTIQAAINAAAASIPAPSSSSVYKVEILDPGEYVEDLTMASWVDVHGEAARLRGGIAGRSNTVIEIEQQTCPTGDNAYQVDVGAGASGERAEYRVKKVTLEGTASGIVNASAAALLARVDTMITDTGAVIVPFSTGHIHYQGKDVYLNGNNATGFYVTAGAVIVHVDHILSMGGATGTRATFGAGAGRLDVRVGHLNAHIGARVTGAGGTINIFASEYDPQTTSVDISAASTVNILAVSDTGVADSISGGGVVNRVSPPSGPVDHATTHQSGGSDAIKLDDLAPPDDNTDLDATTSAHGLLPKLSGNAAEALLGDGTFGAVGGGVDGSVGGTDNAILRADVGPGEVQGSGVTISDVAANVVTIQPGAALGTPTGVTIEGGTGDPAAGGSPIVVQAGDDGAFSTDGGGTVTINGGDSTLSLGGSVFINAGESENSNGGSIQLNAGGGGVSDETGNGGSIALTAGNAGETSGLAGNITLTAGEASTGSSGSVIINGGDSDFFGNASGGSVSIFAGNGRNGGFGGSVTIDCGTGAAGSQVAVGLSNATSVRIGRSAGQLGFFGATPISRPTVTGSRGGNAALASFLTEMENLGLITDSTT